MAVMFGSLYRALVSAGVADEQAQKAAEEVAGYETSLTEVRADIAGVRSDVALLKWMVGFNLALTAAIAVKLLLPVS